MYLDGHNMTQIDYASVSTASSNARLFRAIALVCAIVPMAVGLLIVLGYWATYQRALPMIGFFWLGIGTIIVIFGIVYLAISRRMERRSEQGSETSPHRRKQPYIFWLLCSNFPVGIFCACFGSYLVNRAVIEVYNLSGAPIDDVVLFIPTQLAPHTEHLGPLPAGANFRYSTGENLDGTLTVTLHQGGIENRVYSNYLSEEGTHDRIFIDPGHSTRIEKLK